LSLTAAAEGGSEPGQHQRFDRILLASEGRDIPNPAIERVLELAEEGAAVHVFSIARVHGVSFGMQVPGLLPTSRSGSSNATSSPRRSSGSSARA
jgi:hypothetical protein